MSTRNDVRTCPCGVKVSQKYSWDAHIRSRRHAERLGVLQTSLTSQGRPAIQQIANAGGNSAHHFTPANGPQPTDLGFTHCALCDIFVLPNQWQSHIGSSQHRQQQRLRSRQSAFEDAARDKNGITVSEPAGIDFGIVETEDALRSSSSQSTVATIKNTNTGRSSIKLMSIRMTSSPRQDAHGSSFSATRLGNIAWLQSNCYLKVVISFHPSYQGRYEDTLELLFFDRHRRTNFAIIRQLRATVGSRADHEQLQATAPYVRRQYVPLEQVLDIIPAERPSTWTPTKWARVLPGFDCPANLVNTAFSPGPNARGEVIRNFLPSVFNSTTYGRRFQTPLFIEEEQCRRDLDQYSMSGVELTPQHPRYKLQVAGLAEGRPSVVAGGLLLVKQTGSPQTDKWYAGCIHEVYANYVSLRFSSDFSTFRGTKYDVRFVLNRIPYRRMYQALLSSFQPDRLLFPGPNDILHATAVTANQLNDIRPVNRMVGEDAEQLQTVAAILNQPSGSVPFVVFGPPGTGKTVTIVEAILQLLSRDPKICILACAPSNSAADQIAMKLSAVLEPLELFRLNSITRKYKDLAMDLRRYSLTNDNDVFVIPSRQILGKFRVVVSTCVTGGVPYGLGMKPGHFTHIFIDEAGQAMEPELMVPIKTIGNDSTNVILAGDNKQLGPIVRSKIAASLGLKESYLARLMARPIYDLHPQGGGAAGGSGITIVKLVKHWRSHPSIMRFSNERFYQNELQPCADPVLTHSMLRSSVLVSPHFPVVFHGIVGKDEREASSPSFFNIDEATQVKQYCKDLVNDRKLRVRPQEIGIITPYHAQRHKILNILPANLREIKVGSVEEFQGQERRIIIMSTVRSSMDFVRYDIRHTLGFVANARRFNVAITRAQAMLVIVGNPLVLSLDPLWRSFLNYVHTNGGWRGKEIDWDPGETVREDGGYDQEIREQAVGEVEEMMRRLRSFVVENSEDLTGAHDDNSGDGDGEAYVDQPWREYE